MENVWKCVCRILSVYIFTYLIVRRPPVANSYPNPVKLSGSTFSPIRLSGLKQESSVLVVLYDVTGKEYYSKVILTSVGGQAELVLESSESLSPGVYLIKASSDNTLLSKKLIVE